MSRSRRKSKPKEFSKIILASVAFVALAIVIVSVVLMFMTRDLSPLGYLIPSVFAELAVGTGFYYTKAKAENKLKIFIAAKREGIDVHDILSE